MKKGSKISEVISKWKLSHYLVDVFSMQYQKQSTKEVDMKQPDITLQ